MRAGERPTSSGPAARRPRWFDPTVEFALEEALPERSTLPTLVVLPGLDGSGITAMTQFAELAQAYSLRALEVPPCDRSSFDEFCDLVDAEIAQHTGEVVVLGESMGAGVAIAVAKRAEARGSPLRGLVLVSPATGWDRTWLGAQRARLLELPDALLGLVIGLTVYQIGDVAQLANAASRLASGAWPRLLSTEARQQFLLRIIRELPARLTSPPATVRHRLKEWIEPTLAARAVAPSLARTPLLVVAGTADARVPAAEEAKHFRSVMGDRCTVHLVEGAGHAGALDERIDLRHVMQNWLDTPGRTAT